MLDTYRLQTRQLLQYPAGPQALYTDSDLNGWINRARQQLAGESNSVRILATISTVANQQPYNFTDLNTGVSASNGVGGALHIRSIMYDVGSGKKWIRPRQWPWFQLFKLNDAVPPTGSPEVWSQYGQGATDGSFWIAPVPDDVYVLTCDCVCLPIDLVDDTTVEAIPALWRDAVCFYAAYLALLSAQSAQRQNDADRMFERYTKYVERARKFATPEVNSYLYPQNPSPTMINKLGLTPKAGAG